MLMDQGASFRKNNISNMLMSVFLGAAIFLAGFFSHAQAGLASLYVITVLLLPDTMPKRCIITVDVTCAVLATYVFISGDYIGLLSEVVFLFINILMYLYIAYFVFWRRNHEANIDITPQPNLQDNVQQSFVKFDDDFRTAILAQMTSSIAHDLSQPISALTIGSEASLRWLRSDVCNIDEARNAVGNVIVNARRAGEVITRVRQLAGRETVMWEKVSPNTLIKRALWTTQDTLARHQATLELLLADGLPEVIGNRKLLDKVFADLLAHIVETLPSGLPSSRLVGETKMRVNYFGTSEILLDMGVRAAIDSFDGFSPEFVGIAERADDMIGSKLSVCRYVIESHSWRIDVVSNPSHGVAFRIKIPIQKDTRLDVE